jgi:thioredoxin reductase (NADPH)
MIGDYMDRKGVKFIKGAVPSKIEKTEDDKRNVTWVDAKDNKTEKGNKIFDTVMLAIGR